MFRRSLLITVIVCSIYVNADCTKCAKNRLDTGNVPVYDLIRQFHMSDIQEQHELITGSILSQKAYQLHRESNLTMFTYDVFPSGIPDHFWFESTFRAQYQPLQPWYLLHVTNSHEVTQISVSMDATEQLVAIGLPDVMGNVQRVFFHNSNLFDKSWHKILVSVVQDQVRMWIDCQQTLGARGDTIEPLLPRKTFETNGGHTYISKFVDETNGYTQENALIDLQWMVLGCESTRPTKPSCEELPQFQAATVPESPLVFQPSYEQLTEAPASVPVTVLIPAPAPISHQECTIQCPAGLPGSNGLPGLNGERGERGYHGEKGEKGEPGTIITRASGESNSFGELQIREICSNIVREELAAMKPSLIGPAGPPGRARAGKPGPPGETGAPGSKGEKGERGEEGHGRVGPQGPQGPQGMPGLDIVGPPGPQGDRGDVGRTGSPGEPGPPGQCPSDCYYTQMYMQQLQAAHAQQQQSKGPSPLSYNIKG